MFTHRSNLKVHLQKVEYGSSLKNTLNSFNVANSHCRPCSIPSISMAFITFGTPLAPNDPDNVISQSLVNVITTYQQHSRTRQTIGAQAHCQGRVHSLVALILQTSILPVLLVHYRENTVLFHPEIDSPIGYLYNICQFSSKTISKWRLRTSINLGSENFLAKAINPCLIVIADGRVPSVYHVELGADLVADSSRDTHFVEDFQTLSWVEFPV